MSDDSTNDATPDEPKFVQPVGETDTDATSDQIDAYDLDGDGKISLVENERARLGIVDAKLEELAERDGITGKLAQAAHEVVDRLDND